MIDSYSYILGALTGLGAAMGVGVRMYPEIGAGAATGAGVLIYPPVGAGDTGARAAMAEGFAMALGVGTTDGTGGTGGIMLPKLWYICPFSL